MCVHIVSYRCRCHSNADYMQLWSCFFSYSCVCEILAQVVKWARKWNDQLLGLGGKRSKSHDAELRFGDLADLFGRVGFLVTFTVVFSSSGYRVDTSLFTIKMVVQLVHDSRLPSRRRISGSAEFLPPPKIRRKNYGRCKRRRICKSGEPPQKLRLTFGWVYHFTEPKTVYFAYWLQAINLGFQNVSTQR